MKHDAQDHTPLHGWTVIGLRASGQQAAIRRAARLLGAGFIGLPGFRLLPAEDAQHATAALRSALAAPYCLFTSPAAVRFANRLVTLSSFDTRWLAIGSGTAAALRRAGCRDVRAPTRQMRSEGVLDLPELSPPPAQLGLVTAPGGRGEIQRRLHAAGCDLRVADVYRRVAAVPTAAMLQRLRALDGPAAVLVSSGEALRNLLAQLEPAARRKLLAACAVCSSERLRALAIECGFRQTLPSDSTRPSRQLSELRRYAEREGFR